MKLYKKVDVLNDKKTIIWLNVVSLLLLIVFGILFALLSSLLNPELFSLGQYDLIETVLLLLAYFAIIVIHELIHGFFFKVFKPEGKVTFGFKNGMAYAASVGNHYSKGKYAVIILAPFILITLGLTILSSLHTIDSLMYISLASLHAASCIGDFYYIAILIRAPKNVLVEDTSAGMSVFLNASEE